jgi:hypothetical protein
MAFVYRASAALPFIATQRSQPRLASPDIREENGLCQGLIHRRQAINLGKKLGHNCHAIEGKFCATQKSK